MRDKTGLDVVVGGRVMACELVNIFRAERHKDIKSKIGHRSANQVVPAIILAKTERKRLNQGTFAGLYCNIAYGHWALSNEHPELDATAEDAISRTLFQD